jgi:integrase/recombinase XerC
MPRPPKLWRRKGRPGWYATLDGRQVNLGDSRAEAEREFHRRKALQQSVPPSKATIGRLVAGYLAWAEPRVKPKTFANYRSYLQSWVNSAGSLQAHRLKPAHVQGWLDAHEWNGSTTHLALTILRLWAAWCDERGHDLSPAVRKVKKPPMGRRPAVSAEDLQAVLAAIVQPQFRDYATVLLDVGCRPGELSSLDAASIDWATSTATVRGKTGPRLVGLTPRALEILRRQAILHPAGPVFLNSRGNPWTKESIDSQFARACRRAGIKGIVSYHARHAFWARANKAGLSDIVIAKQLGHANLNMLARHYAAVDPEMLRDAARKASPEE